jgi:hypothetical protein
VRLLRAGASGGALLLCVCCNAIFGIDDPRHRAGGRGGAGVAGKSGSGGSGAAGKGGAGGRAGGNQAGASGESGAGGGSPAGGSSGKDGIGGTTSGGNGVGGGGEAGEAGSASLGVAITSPSRTVYTNATVTFEILVDGTPDSLDLLADGKTVKHLGTTRKYLWDTTGSTEGIHQVTARAKFGTETRESDPRAVVVDRTAPQVSQRVPEGGAADVFIGDPITVTFSEPMDPNTVSSGTISLTVDGSPVSVDATPSDGGTVVTLKPQSPIAAPATLEATLSTKLRDRAGNALTAPEQWSWQLPEWAPIGGVYGTPDKAVNECFLALGLDGQPAVVLSDQQGSAAIVQQWDGASWSQLGDAINTTGNLVLVSYLVNVAGKPTVALKESDGMYVNGYVEQWDGTRWVQLGGAINPLVTSDIQDALPATNGNGDLVVGVWQGVGGLEPYSGYLFRWNGSTWDPLGAGYNAVAGGSIHLKPAVALDEGGQPYLVWGEKETTNYDDYVVTYTDGWQTVGGKVNPEPGLNMGGQGLLAISKNSGFPFTAMRSDDDTPPNAYAMYWDGAQWKKIGGAINAVPNQTVTYGTKAFALTSEDIPLLAIVESDGVANNAYVLKWSGSEWQTMGGAVNPIPGQSINRLRMTLDDADRPIISMLDSNAINNKCYVYRSNN